MGCVVFLTIQSVINASYQFNRADEKPKDLKGMNLVLIKMRIIFQQANILKNKHICISHEMIERRNA